MTDNLIGRIAIQGHSIDDEFMALVEEINRWIDLNYEEETEIVGVNLKGPAMEINSQDIIPIELVIKFYTDEAHNLFRLIFLKRCEPFFHPSPWYKPAGLMRGLIQAEPSGD